jgi:hypothetical protein
MFAVHKNRFTQEASSNAMGENYMNASLEKIANSVYTNEGIFCKIMPGGKLEEKADFINTEIAYTWNILYTDAYAQDLNTKIRALANREKGWMVGQNPGTGEKVGLYSAFTNGTILEALNYKANGPVINR